MTVSQMSFNSLRADTAFRVRSQSGRAAVEKVVGGHGNEECRQHVESDAPRVGDATGESFQRARQHDEQSAARYGSDAVERTSDTYIQALLVRVERQHVKTVGRDVVGGTAEKPSTIGTSGVKTRKWAEGSVKATPAMAAAMRNSMASIHHLLLLARSMNGLHRGLTTHGR